MVQVIARSTQTTLDCPPSTPANSPLTCTVTVQDTASGTKSPPVGTVSFMITGGPAGSTSSVTPCALAPTTASSSSCTVMFTANKPGNYTIAATYSPAADSIHAGSSGTDMVQVIARSTQTTLDCPASTPANSPLSCTVTVEDTASGTKSPPVGTVSFMITGGPAGSTSSVTPCALAPTTTSSSSCTVMFTANKPANYTIAATYSPAADSIHAGSSGTDMVQVIARSTQTTLDCPPSTPANSPLSCTVTVQDTASGTKSAPVGTVSFTISGGPAGSTASVTPCALGPTTTSSSSCTVMFTANKPGNYTITATYSPAADSIHAGSSGADTVMVTRRSTMTTVDCTPPTVPAGVSTTCTATVTDNDTGTPITPSGTVTFTSSGSGTFSPAASCTLTGAGATATCSVTYTPAPVGGNATQTITATYGGDQTHLGSSGATNIVVLALPGKVTGGGQVDLDGGGRASFGFVVQRQTIGGLATGELEYHNHANRVNVHSLGMLTLLIVDNTATFTGSCRVNNTTPCTFTVTVQDNGEPGSRGPNKDKFSITVFATPAEMVTLRDLRAGNIKIHNSEFDSDSLVVAAAEGVFPSGASLNGVRLDGLQVGKGIITSADRSARGDFQTVLLGTSILGQPQKISVEGPASSGSRNADGSVNFAGLSSVDMGDGTAPLTGVPFSVTATTQGLTLTLGLTVLPTATLTAGHITIK
ncbi:MAG: Ig-like domain repeat protein [Deltaproteobacteria bacterium]|nr:MAG: Ig-like domain repeat protein [Deltaproteobacteria bacterium]